MEFITFAIENSVQLVRNIIYKHKTCYSKCGIELNMDWK